MNKHNATYFEPEQDLSISISQHVFEISIAYKKTRCNNCIHR